MIIDFCAHYGDGPGVPSCYTPDELLRLEKSAGIDMAVASDLGDAFGDLCSDQATPDGLVRFAGVSPEYDAGRLDSARGVRLYPTYQEWDLDGPEMGDLLAVAREQGLIVQFCLRLQDPRVLPQVVASGKVIEALDALIAANTDIRFVVSGANLAEIRGNTAPFVRENVWTDISHLQHPIHSLTKLIGILGSSRLLFASNAPVFHPYMAVFRALNEAIGEEDRERVLWRNAKELLA